MPDPLEESAYRPVWSLSSQPFERTSKYTLTPSSAFLPPDYSTISALEISRASPTPRSRWGQNLQGYSPSNLEVSSSQPSQASDPLIDGYIAATFGLPSTSSLFTTLLCNSAQDKLYGGVLSHHPLGFFVTDSPVARRPQPHDRPSGYDSQATTPCGRQTVSIDYRYLSTINANLGMVIPQRLWEARTPSAKSKHANKAPGNLSAPIFFIPADCNDRMGIPFADALAGTGTKLRGGDQSVDMGASSTNIHIMWEGYENSKRQVQLRQCRGGARPPITLETLAKFIARSIDLFFQEAKRDPSVPLSDCWSIEAGNVQKERILIIGLIQTSLGGWQPILQTF